MKTREELQAAVDEILAVCAKHGVVLVATASSEGIYGEIAIGGAAPGEIAWSDFEGQITNRVEGREGDFYIEGIGDLLP